MKLFLDTNILIDFILERPQFYPTAAMIVSYAVERKIEIAVSALSVVTANFICVVRSKMSDDIYRRKIDFLRDFMTICSVNDWDVYHSYDTKWKDFEDGVQYASAKRWNPDFLVTRNVKDFEEHDIAVVTSEEMCEILMKECAAE